MSTNYEYVGDLNSLLNSNIIVDSTATLITSQDYVDYEMIGNSYTTLLTADKVLDNVIDGTIQITTRNGVNSTLLLRKKESCILWK